MPFSCKHVVTCDQEKLNWSSMSVSHKVFTYASRENTLASQKILKNGAVLGHGCLQMPSNNMYTKHGLTTSLPEGLHSALEPDTSTARVVGRGKTRPGANMLRRGRCFCFFVFFLVGPPSIWDMLRYISTFLQEQMPEMLLFYSVFFGLMAFSGDWPNARVVS